MSSVQSLNHHTIRPHPNGVHIVEVSSLPSVRDDSTFPHPNGVHIVELSSLPSLHDVQSTIIIRDVPILMVSTL